MAEQSPQFNLAEVVPALAEGHVEFSYVDPAEVSQAATKLTADLEQHTGREYSAQPGTVSRTLLPFRATSEGELAAFVVTEGRGAVELVAGKENAVRQDVEPGSVLLVQPTEDLNTTPWMRADPRNTQPLSGYFILGKETLDESSQAANDRLTLGAKGRREAGRYMERIANDKLRALGKLGTQGSQD